MNEECGKPPTPPFDDDYRRMDTANSNINLVRANLTIALNELESLEKILIEIMDSDRESITETDVKLIKIFLEDFKTKIEKLNRFGNTLKRLIELKA